MESSQALPHLCLCVLVPNLAQCAHIVPKGVLGVHWPGVNGADQALVHESGCLQAQQGALSAGGIPAVVRSESVCRRTCRRTLAAVKR